MEKTTEFNFKFLLDAVETLLHNVCFCKKYEEWDSLEDNACPCNDCYIKRLKEEIKELKD